MVPVQVLAVGCSGQQVLSAARPPGGSSARLKEMSKPRNKTPLARSGRLIVASASCKPLQLLSTIDKWPARPRQPVVAPRINPNRPPLQAEAHDQARIASARAGYRWGDTSGANPKGRPNKFTRRARLKTPVTTCCKLPRRCICCLVGEINGLVVQSKPAANQFHGLARKSRARN